MVDIERRSYPRINTNLRIEFSEGIEAESMDLSEGGLSFNSIENLSVPIISLQIHFPDREMEFKAKAELIWRKDFSAERFLYGAKFFDIDETQRISLRKELIKLKISGLLDEIQNPEIKRELSHFFLKVVSDYITEIIRLGSLICDGEGYSVEIEENLEHLNTLTLLKGYCLEELVSDVTIMPKVKDNFRQLVSVWVYRSLILKRGLDKPRGYPADYQMQEIIYDNKPISKDMGAYFDNNFLKSPYTVAVRLRKDRMRELVLGFINQTKQDKINILNISCGSCREIRELLPNLKTQSAIKFSCLDADEGALNFAQDMLSRNAPKNVEFKFIKKDIQSQDQQNLIYSIGLADYLPDHELKDLIRLLYQLLPEGGKLILTHKNKEKTFPPIVPDWFCDWKFLPRNKEEVINLFYTCGIPRFSLSVESDDFGYIFYYILTKHN